VKKDDMGKDAVARVATVDDENCMVNYNFSMKSCSFISEI
jgi:hypothetical protein